MVYVSKDVPSMNGLIIWLYNAHKNVQPIHLVSITQQQLHQLHTVFAKTNAHRVSMQEILTTSVCPIVWLILLGRICGVIMILIGVCMYLQTAPMALMAIIKLICVSTLLDAPLSAPHLLFNMLLTIFPDSVYLSALPPILLIWTGLTWLRNYV